MTMEGEISAIAADFPGGPVVQNLPTNAGGHGSIPDLGTSHMPQRN